MLVIVAFAAIAVAVDTFVRRGPRLPFGGLSSVAIGALGVLTGSALIFSADVDGPTRAIGSFAIVLGAALAAVGPARAYRSLPGRSPRLARLTSTRSSMVLGSGAALLLLWRVLSTWTPGGDERADRSAIVDAERPLTIAGESLERATTQAIGEAAESPALAFSRAIDAGILQDQPVIRLSDDVVAVLESSGSTPFWQQVSGIGLIVFVVVGLITGFFVRRSARNETDRDAAVVEAAPF